MMLAQVVVKLVESDGVRIDRRPAHLIHFYRDMRFQLLEEAVDILDVACVPAGWLECLPRGTIAARSPTTAASCSVVSVPFTASTGISSARSLSSESV